MVIVYENDDLDFYGRSSDAFCTSKLYHNYIIFEYAVASFPYVVLFLLGLYRYIDIRSIGTKRVQVYSCSFIIKVTLCACSGILYLVAFGTLLSLKDRR